MRRQPCRVFILGLGWFLCAAACPAEQPLPPASEVTRRMIERATAVARDTNGPRYACEKRSLVEHLDAAGRTTRAEEKLYQVTWAAGFPFNRLVRIQGRELTREELEKEQHREERFQERMTSLNPRRMAARREGWVTPQLLDRFDFTVRERVLLNQRPTLVLTFTPRKTEAQDRTWHDRLLGGFAGTLWVDEEDMDTAQMTIRLAEAVSFGWLGVLGALSQCDLHLQRQRMPDGAWVNVHQTLRVQARKLAAPIRVAMTEHYSAFEKIVAPR